MTRLLIAAALSLAIFSAQTATSTLAIRGQTEPAARVEVPAGMKGQLLTVDVTQGQGVKKGDKLAKLDDAIQQTVVSLAKMQADSTAEIRYAQNQLDFAKLENEKWQANPTATDLEKRQKALAVTQADLS